MAHLSTEIDQRRKSAVKTAIVIGLVALAIYVGFFFSVASQ